MAGYIKDLGGLRLGQQLQHLRRAAGARRIEQERGGPGLEAREHKRQKGLRPAGQEAAIGFAARQGVLPRRLDRGGVHFHAGKALHQIGQFDAEKAHAAISVNQEARPGGAQPFPDRFHQLGQEKEIVLKKRIGRDDPAFGRDAQHHLEAAFGRRMAADLLDLRR